MILRALSPLHLPVISLVFCPGTWDPSVPKCPFCHNLPRLSPQNLHRILRSFEGETLGGFSLCVAAPAGGRSLRCRGPRRISCRSLTTVRTYSCNPLWRIPAAAVWSVLTAATPYMENPYCSLYGPYLQLQSLIWRIPAAACVGRRHKQIAWRPGGVAPFPIAPH